ncbi:MAG: YceI family protein [Acidimicrobiales bacterium]
MNKLTWALATALALVVLVVGGTWVYINVIRDDAPPPLAFDDTTTTTGADAATTTTAATAPARDGIEGEWVVADGSVVGYRVEEILFGQSTEGVGRTEDVVGSMTVEGTTVTQARFEADMATVESDDSRRDNQFRGRIMDVSTHPTATVELVEPIDLGAVPGDREEVTRTAVVDLTLRGTTRTVPIDLDARRNGDRIEVTGAIPVVFAEWDIPNPSTAGITTEDVGLLEFLIVFDPA